MKTEKIEWFNPQDNRMDGCRAELQAASVKNCTLMVAVLMKDKVGNYTCRARNS